MRKAIVPERTTNGKAMAQSASEGRRRCFPRPRLGTGPLFCFGFVLWSPLLVLLVAPPAQALAAAETPIQAPASPDHIHRLIESLGNPDYFVRQKAESDLGKIGFEAVDALTAATENDDMEIATRAYRLLGTIRSNWSIPGEPAAVLPLLADYEAQDDSGREARIISLIGLPANEGIPAVCRAIRYDRSAVLAKTAALRLLEALAGETVKPDLVSRLQKDLGNCPRPSAQWVLSWLQAREDPKALAAAWTRLVDEEEGRMLRQPRDTSLSIVEDLLRLQIAALRKADRGAEAAGSVERLIKLRRTDPAELARLLNWFIDQKDWSATRLVEERCQATIAESASLLYLVAEGRLRRGEAAAAEKSAGQALKLRPGSDERALAMHFQVGAYLEGRGRFDWAAKEWEHVIREATPLSRIGVTAARLLAELYHDLEQDERAAETLGGIEKAYTKRSNQWPLFSDDGSDAETLGSLRARKYFFDACRWKVQGDRIRQRECLDKALATQSYDIEALIDCYQLPDSTQDYRAKIRGLIEKRLCGLREQIADIGPYSAAAGPCNEFAWLAANTEGDLDEALRFSKRSLELAGEQGAYCDTLARVYFAKGDYASAVSNQARAAALMPDNRAIQKQLQLFRKKAREKGIPPEQIEKSEKAAAPVEKEAAPIEDGATKDDNPFGS